MKAVVLLLVFMVGGALSQDLAADDAFLVKQSAILTLLQRIHDPNDDPEQSDISRDYIPANNLHKYKNPDTVKDLLAKYNGGKLLKRNVYFSLFDEDHREQMISFFEILWGAPSLETFYKTACWARDRLNEGIFVYGLSVAVLHRSDMRGIRLPPPYEINPHYFAPATVISEAYRAKMKGESKVITMNFTGTPRNYEQRVAYFGEDVEMNAHHHHWHMDFPFWWKQEYGQQKDRKGELFFYMHHQLTSRYDHERLSNNLDPVKALGWSDKIEEGFAPLTSYKGEGDFPSRPDGMSFQDLPNLSIRRMKNLEDRIRKAVDSQLVLAEGGDIIPLTINSGIEVLGDIIESSTSSPNQLYYGSLHNSAHVMLSRVVDPLGKYGTPPGVMEHFETATRDPAFFKLHKYLDNIFRKYKQNLPPYTKAELRLPGVNFKDIDVQSQSRAVSKNTLITFFEDFYFSLNNALDTNPGQAGEVNMQAKTRRMDHEDFKYIIKATSDRERVVTVRLFLKPKTPAEDDDYLWLLTEMDKFTAKLKKGDNVIYRKSKDSSVTVPDRSGFEQLWKEVNDAKSGKKPMTVNPQHRHCGQPDRLLLPKGKREGMEYELFGVMTDWESDKVRAGQLPDDQFGGSLAYCGAIDGLYPDNKPMGFPFDRRVKIQSQFWQPNFVYKIISIKHIPDE